MRPLLNTHVLPLKRANPSLIRPYPNPPHPSLFVPNVLDPEGIVIDEKALEPHIVRDRRAPQFEFNCFNPPLLNDERPVGDSHEFIRQKPFNLLTGACDDEITPAIVGHSAIVNRVGFMPQFV